MDALIREIRFALRNLARRRAFAATVVVTLALGIAANTTVFSLVSGSLLRQPPFTAADRLVIVYRSWAEAGREPRLTRWSYPRFAAVRRTSRSFESIASFGRGELNLSGGGDPERVSSETVSAGYFETLRAGPALGRVFRPDEDSIPGAVPVAVLSHGLWVRRFGADSAVVGRSLRANGAILTVIGVMPAGFQGLTGRAEVWVPEMMAPRLQYPDHLTTNQNFISVVARLAPGVSLEAARGELAVTGPRIAATYPDDVETPTTWSATAIPIAEARIDPGNRRALLFLFAAVGFLLLLACTNVAGLGLAEAVGRRQEITVRLALGASRRRIAGQLLTESAVLGVAGGGLGALLAAFVTRVAQMPAAAAGPGNMYGTLGDFATTPMDGTVLMFSVLVSVLAVIVSGLAPALYAGRTDLATELKDRTASGGARTGGGSLIQATLVVLEVALALMLSVGGGLLFASLRRFQAIPLGVDPTNVLTFRIQPSDVEYPSSRAPELIDRVLAAVRQVPRVTSATVDACPPLGTSCANSTLYVIGRPEPRPGQAPPITRHYVGPDHFATLGIPILAGRPFGPDDRGGRPHVTIINQTAARRFFPGENPLGRQVWFGGGSTFDRPDSSATIIGIVGDVPYGALDRDQVPSFYTPYRQFTYAFRTVMVKIAGDPLAAVPAIRGAVRSVDELPITDVGLLSDRLGDAWARTRFTALLMGVFAGLALLLAAGGVYGIIAHSVSQRTRELGIRTALGATAGNLLRMVVGQGVRLALVGVGIGVVAALALGRLARGLLFEVEATDPLVIGAQVVVLVGAAALASYLPARRAARVDPVTSLRAD